MRKLTTLLAGSLLCSSLSAQTDCIVRHRADAPPAFFYGPNTVANLQAIINSSSDGDTIYLPAVDYYFGTTNLLVRHGVILVGSGIHPDSTTASSGLKTRFLGDDAASGHTRIVNEGSGNNGSSAEFHGITFTRTVTLGNAIGNLHSTTAVHNVKFYRCDIVSLYLGFPSPTAYTSAATNTLVSGLLLSG